MAVVQLAGSASAAPVVRWVAPTGAGTTCSATAPCSVATAQAQVRADRAMSTDLVIRFTSGDYGAIRLNASDSGTGGHVVRYEAAPGAEARITGARRISGWTLSDPAKNIWQASVPRSFTSRQLYVDGVRASLASKPAAEVLGSMTKTSTGYTASRSTMSTWRNLTDAELVFPAGGHDPEGKSPSVVPWTWSMCGVSSVAGAKIAVDPACWNKAATVLGDMPWFLSEPTIVQNNHALLGTPGQFYLDDPADKVYYVPRSGEKLSSATVVMPEATSLLTATGSASSPVEDVQISGLTFEYATWLPSPTMGVIDVQSNVIGGDSPSGLAMIPSAVSFDHTKRMVFERNVLRRLGGGGVSSTRGVDATLRGNVVTDVSSTGISIGDGIAWSSPSTYESRATVSNNVVKDVAVEFQGGVGIFGGWTKHAKITHNEVSDLPFMGISLGWGWNNPSGMVDNHIDHNLVRNVHESSLFDGGAIYVLGAQGDAASSTISSNYVSGDGQPYGALYLDAGASNWTVKNNVVDRAPHGWLYVQNMDGATTRDNLVTSNYADTTKQQGAPLGLSKANSVTGNHLGLSTWPAAARAIVDAAGLEAAYADLKPAPAPEPAPEPAAKPAPKVLVPVKKVKVSGPRTAKVKSRIRVRATGLAARERYSIRVSGKKVHSGTATSAGKVNRHIRIPKSVKTGKRTVTVVAAQSNRKVSFKLRIR